MTLHSHAPNQDLNDNVIRNNRLSNNALAGNMGQPGDGDFGVSGTIGLLVASAVTQLTGIQITGNQISNVHFGIWTMNVAVPATTLSTTNRFSNVQIPVFTS